MEVKAVIPILSHNVKPTPQNGLQPTEDDNYIDTYRPLGEKTQNYLGMLHFFQWAYYME